jgi:uncharacterized membrane protein YphA (DoxX/SURF4 family)
VLDTLGTLARLGLAAVWLVSGAVKISDSGQTFIAVKAYDVLPSALIGPVATALPLLELVLGVFLLFGLGTRVVAVVVGLLLLVLIAGIAQSWARGLSIDCGCFGGGGQVGAGQTQYPQEIARDTGFLVLAVWLMVRPRTFGSGDSWLGWGRGNSAARADDYSDEKSKSFSEGN